MQPPKTADDVARELAQLAKDGAPIAEIERLAEDWVYLLAHEAAVRFGMSFDDAWAGVMMSLRNLSNQAAPGSTLPTSGGTPEGLGD